MEELASMSNMRGMLSFLDTKPEEYARLFGLQETPVESSSLPRPESDKTAASPPEVGKRLHSAAAIVLESPALRGLLPNTSDAAPSANLTGGPHDNLTVQTPVKLAPPPPDTLMDREAIGIGHPPNNLTAPPPDTLKPAGAGNLTGGGNVNLTGGPPDNLAAPPPDTLGAPGSNETTITYPSNAYQTLDGVIVDSQCIRPFDSVQAAHTASEHLVYMTMWKALGSREDDNASREGIVALRDIQAKVSISKRNLTRVVHSLEQKLALEVTGYEDKTRWIPRRYRVWGFRATLDRRRAAGYSFVYRNRNAITLARSFSPTPPNLTLGATDKLTGAPPVKLASPPPDNMRGSPPDKLSPFLSNRDESNKTSSSKNVSPLIAAAIRHELGIVDDDAICALSQACRAIAPDATDEEIADLGAMQARRILRMGRKIDNPIGFLIKALPKHFAGESFALFRRENEEQARRFEESQQEEEPDPTR